MGSNKAERNQHSFQVGDKVRLSEDGEQRHPELTGRIGSVSRVATFVVDVRWHKKGNAMIHSTEELSPYEDRGSVRTKAQLDSREAYLAVSASLNSTLTQIRQGYNLSIKDTIKLLSSAIVSLMEELE